MDYTNLFTIEKYMIDYSKVIAFLDRIKNTDLDNLIKVFEKEITNVDMLYGNLYNQRLTDDNQCIGLIYLEDLNYILSGLKYIKSDDTGGWADCINNEIQQKRNLKLRYIIEDKLNLT